MTTYLDSSALVPMYVPGQFSASARVAVHTAGQVPFTALHQLEVPSAFEMLVGRGLLTGDGGHAVQLQLREDLDHQRLSAVSPDLEQVFIDAARMSRKHTAKLLTRSLDLLRKTEISLPPPGLDRQFAALCRQWAFLAIVRP